MSSRKLFILLLIIVALIAAIVYIGLQGQSPRFVPPSTTRVEIIGEVALDAMSEGLVEREDGRVMVYDAYGALYDLEKRKNAHLWNDPSQLVLSYQETESGYALVSLDRASFFCKDKTIVLNDLYSPSLNCREDICALTDRDGNLRLVDLESESIIMARNQQLPLNCVQVIPISFSDKQYIYFVNQEEYTEIYLSQRGVDKFVGRSDGELTGANLAGNNLTVTTDRKWYVYTLDPFVCISSVDPGVFDRVKIQNEGKYIVSYNYSSELRVWSVYDDADTRILLPTDDPITTVLFARDSDVLYVLTATLSHAVVHSVDISDF